MKIILRSEYKNSERRTPLIPAHAAKLVEAGYQLFVEESQNRLFSIDEYKAVGCQIIPEHSWEQEEANPNTIILGLKELPLNFSKISGKHIYFAHIFKGQDHSSQSFNQLSKGNGTLYDLEFLQNQEGRRVAAFGYWAGYVGAALSLWQYFLKQNSSQLKELQTFESKQELIEQVRKTATNGQAGPKAIVIGARGRCGNGAIDFLNEFHCPVTKWDMQETQKGGPFPEIIQHQIFINCVYLSQEIPPFIDQELVNKSSSLLEVIGDVSCDPNGPWNPVRIYNKHTTWQEPILNIEGTKTGVLAIDNLPSLLPKESSEDFSEQLLPYLLDLKEDKLGVWQRAENIFHEKKAKYI